MNSFAKAAILAFAALGCTIASPAAADVPALLNTIEYRTNDLDALPKWKDTLSRIAKEQGHYADSRSKGVRAWQAMIRGQEGKRQVEQLRSVNNFVNQWRYRSDSYNYQTSDYWASPAEFFARSGDCEDYAIAKYVTLRQMGFRADQLRLVVVKDLVRDLAHAVLAAYVDNEVFILDNVNNQVRPQAAVTEYAPYYSVNEQSRWAHAAMPAKVASADGLFSKS
jgi:predicted transglutaminase-like cysteine proteinase